MMDQNKTGKATPQEWLLNKIDNRNAMGVTDNV